jgi:hypothetical protein
MFADIGMETPTSSIEGIWWNIKASLLGYRRRNLVCIGYLRELFGRY